MKKLLGLMIPVVMAASPLLAKKIDPASFTLTAEVVSVTSKEVVIGAKEDTSIPCNPFYDYCKGRTTTEKKVYSETVYLVAVKIDKLLYTIESQDMPTIGQKNPAKVEGNRMTFLGTDKKGRPYTWFRKIVGVREIPVDVKGETSRPTASQAPDSV